MTQKRPPEGPLITHPVLYSFRRCPYAMRARLAISSAGIQVELREILLRDKPAQMLAASPKGTVPVVIAGTVIEESRDVMHWALEQSDPEGWLDMPSMGFDLIDECDGPFKAALDRTKYAVRYDDVDVAVERHKAGLFLHKLDAMLDGKHFFSGNDLEWQTSLFCHSSDNLPTQTSTGGRPSLC